MAKKIILKIAGMHCSSCAMDIDGTLEDNKGIFCSNTSYAKSQTQVEFDELKIDNKKIIGIIESIGYTAEPTS